MKQSSIPTTRAENERENKINKRNAERNISSAVSTLSLLSIRISDDGRRNERRGQKLMTEERQLIPARAYRGEARQSGFLARRDQSISRTFDKPPFRFSNKALLFPRVQKVGRERKKIRLSFGHPANFLPPFRFFIPPSVDRISTFIPRGDANDPDHSTVPKHSKTFVREYLHRRGKRRRRPSKRRKEGNVSKISKSRRRIRVASNGGWRRFESGYSTEYNYPAFFSSFPFFVLLWTR